MPQHPDDFYFGYDLTGTGWSVGELSYGDARTSLSASYLSDALGNLLTAVWMVGEGEEPARCSWDEEPGEYRWIFSSVGDNVRLLVLWFDDLWGDAPDDTGEPVFDVEVSRQELVRAVSEAAQAVLDEYGEEGYKKKWVQHDFPLDTLRLLQGSLGDAAPTP